MAAFLEAFAEADEGVDVAVRADGDEKDVQELLVIFWTGLCIGLKWGREVAMAKAVYIIKKVGDKYVPVRQEPTRGAACGGWTLGGAILVLHGLRRDGITGAAFTLAGTAMVYRGITGRNP